MTTKPTREELAQRTLTRMRDFTEKLKAGVPIEATRVTRIDTPDGPAFIREHAVINLPEGPILEE